MRGGAEIDACAGWDSAGCAGTPHCPPRCPRFVDAAGTPLLFHPLEAAPADREDLHALYDCAEARGAKSYPPYATRRSIATWLEGLMARGWNVLALGDGRCLGHAVLAPADAEEPEFGVFVHPDYRGRGIASELLRQCVAHAIATRRGAVVMEVEQENGAMRAIASRHGFEVVDAPGRDDWIGHVTLELSLDPGRERSGLVSLPV